ncbi:MAG: LpxI family protein [Firmicutes bacterium]|nr:LpxI family protein [Bacillota bacterium]
MVETKPIGLVAGRDNLPFHVLTEIKRRNAKSVVIGLKGEVAPGLAGKADVYREIEVGQIETMLDFLKNEKVVDLVMAGKVGKRAIFEGRFDSRFQRLLQDLPEKNDDAVLLAVVAEFERNGFRVAKQTDYLQRLLAPSGAILGQVTPREMEDLRLGFRMAKAIGDLDIGQSVVVKEGVVLAVEAIEGTDEAIIRGGNLGGPGVIVVKVSKPKQDERFDVPTVGRTTIESMSKVKAGILGVEADKTLITEKEEMIALAREHNIKIIALDQFVLDSAGCSRSSDRV